MQFLTGDLQGSHDLDGVVFTVLAVMSGMEREYIRDRTLERHESARLRGRGIGGASVTDDDMLGMALHLRDQELSLPGRAGPRLAVPLVLLRGPTPAGRGPGQPWHPGTGARSPLAPTPRPPTSASGTPAARRAGQARQPARQGVL
ncbi:hypothetical protein ABT185_23840 [Streptomyces clavifer]|uniref:hypothetical protein n=1 Tax=Streptomyces clavifer TaxID=68188 RepID=UPI0033303C14